VDYLDFEVEVSSLEDGGYAVRVRSPEGEADGTMRFPFDTLALENRLQALQIALLRSAGTRRRIDLPEAKTVQQFGTELWQALFTDDVRGRFEASLSKAKARNLGLRLKLRFDAPELAALPWEYLYDAGRGDYLALSAATPLVRYIPLREPMEPLTIQPPLRVLGLVVSPDDLPGLDVARERQRLDNAVARLRARGVLELEWLPGRTWRDLQEALRRGPWHIFHFIGHGGFDPRRGEGVIALAGDDGRTQLLSATDLGRLLGDHDPLRLAVLNACESARSDQADVFSSTAGVLVRRGTPAVVAMQYEITDAAAIEFSRSFYEAIADGVPVDSAVSEARKGVAVAISDTLEWGTPVLFMRAADGVLFRLPESAGAAPIAAIPVAPDTPADTTVPAAAAAAETSATAQSTPVAAVAPDRVEPPLSVAAPASAAALEAPRAASKPSRYSRSRWPLLGLGAAAVVLVAGLAFLAASMMSPNQSTPTPPAAMALSTDRARPGDVVVVKGSGYDPGETVSILVAGVVRTRTTALDDGTFQTPLTVPGDAGGLPSVEAVGLTSGRSVNRPFIVEPAPTPTAGPSESSGASESPRPSPKVTVSAEEARPGDTLTISGSGFDPAEPVQVSIGGILLDLATADDGGSFSSTVLIPNELAPPGSPAQVMLAAAEGRESDRAASREITIVGKEQIQFRSFSIVPIDPSLFDLCVSGFVWREAFEGDHVCVTPDQRDQAAQDNAAAASRVDPFGAFGPDTCIQGYVWRGAREDDHVCVTREEFDRVAEDNAAAASRVQQP
jgi:hypothetical protein